MGIFPIWLWVWVWEGNGNPLQCSCLENPRDGRAWWAVVYGVTQSQTWLKRLSSGSGCECVYVGAVWEKESERESKNLILKKNFLRSAILLKKLLTGSLNHTMGWTLFRLDWVLCSNLGKSLGKRMEYFFFPSSRRLDFITVPRGYYRPHCKSFPF